MVYQLNTNIDSSEKNVSLSPVSQESNTDTSNQVSQTEMFATMINMLSIVNELHAEFIKLYAQQQQRDSNVAETTSMASQANYTATKAKVDDYIKELEAQKTESWWQKLLSVVIPVLTIIVAFAVFGPGAGIVVGLMTGAGMLLDPNSPIGVAGKALASVMGDKGEFYFSLGVMAAMTLAGGGASALLSRTEAVVEVAEEAGEEAASSAVSGAAEDGAANASEAAEDAGAAKQEPTPQEKLENFQAKRARFLVMTGFSTAFNYCDPFIAGFQAYDPDDLKKKEWLQYVDIAIKLVVAFVDFATSLKGAGEASAIGWKLGSSVKVCGVTVNASKALVWLQQGLNMSSGGLNIWGGLITKSIGDTQNSLKQLDGFNVLFQAIQELVNQNTEQAGNSIKTVQKQASDLNDLARTWSDPITQVAQAMAV